jgi:hypothetical protein
MNTCLSFVLGAAAVVVAAPFVGAVVGVSAFLWPVVPLAMGAGVAAQAFGVGGDSASNNNNKNNNSNQ